MIHTLVLYEIAGMRAKQFTPSLLSEVGVEGGGYRIPSLFSSTKKQHFFFLQKVKRAGAQLSQTVTKLFLFFTPFLLLRCNLNDSKDSDQSPLQNHKT